MSLMQLIIYEYETGIGIISFRSQLPIYKLDVIIWEAISQDMKQMACGCSVIAKLTTSPVRKDFLS